MRKIGKKSVSADTPAEDAVSVVTCRRLLYKSADFHCKTCLRPKAQRALASKKEFRGDFHKPADLVLSPVMHSVHHLLLQLRRVGAALLDEEDAEAEELPPDCRPL